MTPRYDTEPGGIPAVRPRTPSGHDPLGVEYLDRRITKVEDDTGEIKGLRIRQDMFERELAELRASTGQHAIDDKTSAAAATYRALIEEERRKTAEAQTALANRNAEVQSDKRMAVLERGLILLGGIILGFIAGILGAKGIHLP